MTVNRAYMLHKVEKPKKDIYHCHGCGTIYRSEKKNPQCPKGMGRCVGTIQRASARYVG